MSQVSTAELALKAANYYLNDAELELPQAVRAAMVTEGFVDEHREMYNEIYQLAERITASQMERIDE